MRPAQRRHNRIGAILSVVSFSFIFLVVGFYRPLIGLAASILSPDGNITPRNQAILSWVLVLVGLLVLVASLYLWRSPNLSLARRAVAAYRAVFVCDRHHCHPSTRWFVLLPNLIGLFLIAHIFYWVRYPATYRVLYLEDGLFETMTPILYLISIGFMAFTTLNVLKNPEQIRRRRWLVLIYAALVVVFFLYAMEEISWGQRIFGWTTSESFSLNSQHETNLHNFFNPLFKYLYPALSLVVVLPFSSLVLEMKAKRLPLARLVLPHGSLLGLAVMIAAIALIFPREQELIEELFSVAVFFYSLRLFILHRCTEGCVRLTFQPVPAKMRVAPASPAAAKAT